MRPNRDVRCVMGGDDPQQVQKLCATVEMRKYRTTRPHTREGASRGTSAQRRVTARGLYTAQA